MQTEILIILLGAACGYALGRSIGWLAILFLACAFTQEAHAAATYIQMRNNSGSTKYGKIYLDGVPKTSFTTIYNGADNNFGPSGLSGNWVAHWSEDDTEGDADDWEQSWNGDADEGHIFYYTDGPSAPPTYTWGACVTNNSAVRAAFRAQFSAYFPASEVWLDPGQWHCWTNSTTNGAFSAYVSMGWNASSDGTNFAWAYSPTNWGATNGTPSNSIPRYTGGPARDRMPDGSRAGENYTNAVRGDQVASNLQGLAQQDWQQTELTLAQLNAIRSNSAGILTNSSSLGLLQSNLTKIVSNTAANSITMNSNDAWSLGAQASGIVATVTGAMGVAFMTNRSGILGGANPTLWLMPVPTNLANPSQYWDLDPRKTWIWNHATWFRKVALWALVVGGILAAWGIADKCVDRILTYLSGAGGSMLKGALGAIAGLVGGLPGLLLTAGVFALALLGSLVPIIVGTLSSFGAFWTFGYGPLETAAISLLPSDGQDWIREMFALADAWIPIAEAFTIGAALLLWEATALSLAALSCVFAKAMSGGFGGSL